MIRRLNIKKYLEGLRDLLYLPGNSKEKKTRQKDLMKSRMVMHFPHSDPEKQKMIVFYYLYPRHLKLRVGGKRVKALSIDGLCDWPEREQPTPTHLQRRRV